MSINITMPALSPTMEEGKLAKWHVKEGDSVSSGDVIAEIETDKATMEVEAVDEGKIGKIVVPEGTENVKVNAVIAVLLTEGENAADVKAAPPPPAAPAPKPAEAPKPAAAAATSVTTGTVAIAPAAPNPPTDRQQGAARPPHGRLFARRVPVRVADAAARLRRPGPGPGLGKHSPRRAATAARL